jgi:uncharacterized membrane protein
VTRIRVRNELLVINLCSLVLILTISFTDIQALRIVLGLPFILFFPGYALIAALFPRKSDTGTPERLALSIGFSVVITPLIGVLLNYVWAIRLYSILVSLTIFIAAMSAAAWYRRRGVAQDDKVEVTFSVPFSGGGRSSALDRVLSAVLALAFLGAIATLGYVVANPKEGERFSEFYILGDESRPAQLTVGGEAVVVLGAINHEGETMSYAVEVRVAGSLLETTDPIELGHGEKWEGEVRFVPNEACAQTELAQDVNLPADQSPAEVKSVQVASVDYLQPGDEIWIGEEAAELQEINDNTIVLKEGLKQTHAAGTAVTEVQKVEFRLIKIRELGDEGETALSLWVGKDHLVAGVLNQGRSEASYQMGVGIEGVQGEDSKVESVAQPVAIGDEWAQEIDYPFSENYKIELSLYKDGELLYRRSESESYPSLYMWIHVGGSSAGG